MNHEQIERVAALFESAPTVTEIEIRNNGVALRLRRVKPGASATAHAAKIASAAVSALPTLAANAQTKSASATPDLDEDPIDIVARSGGELVTAHMVGVFRATRAGKTDADRVPIASEAVVSQGQSLGNVETMRILNDCSAPVSGTVAHVYVSDGQPVEYGQVLFEIIPAPSAEGPAA